MKDVKDLHRKESSTPLFWFSLACKKVV